jgi:hypothetical protein
VGYRVFRLEFTRRHILVFALSLLVALGGAGGYYVWTLQHAEQRVSELRFLTEDQRDRLQKIDSQAAELESELRAYELQSEQIRKMIGDRGHAADRPALARRRPAATTGNRCALTTTLSVAWRRGSSACAANRLARQSEGDRLRDLALHVLNMRRLEDLARSSCWPRFPR